MTQYTLRLFEDKLPANAAPVYLPALPRAIYVVKGDASFEFDAGADHRGAGSAWLGEGEATILAGAEGATLWRWELLVGGKAGRDGKLMGAPSATSELKLAEEIELDAGFSWLMRCDRVEFPRGGIAYTHVHQGPGIRCTLHGEIRIEIGGVSHTHAAGQAWLELGKDPVLAPTTDTMETTFIRCFLLPQACRGRSSIRYVRAEDAQLPKTQRYHVFGERLLHLG